MIAMRPGRWPAIIRQTKLYRIVRAGPAVARFKNRHAEREKPPAPPPGPSGRRRRSARRHQQPAYRDSIRRSALAGRGQHGGPRYQRVLSGMRRARRWSGNRLLHRLAVDQIRGQGGVETDTPPIPIPAFSVITGGGEKQVAIRRSESAPAGMATTTGKIAGRHERRAGGAEARPACSTISPSPPHIDSHGQHRPGQPVEKVPGVSLSRQDREGVKDKNRSPDDLERQRAGRTGCRATNWSSRKCPRRKKAGGRRRRSAR